MSPKKIFLLLLIGPVIASCAFQSATTLTTTTPTTTTSTTTTPITTQLPLTDNYCDKYLIYKMCARDIDGNGEVDLIYFEDTREVFMVAREFQHRTFDDLSPHRCLQLMDARVRAASSELLSISEDSSTLHKTQVKSRLMLNYARYYPRINACMNGPNVIGLQGADDSFGDEDFEEF